MELYERDDVLVVKPDTYVDLSFKRDVQSEVLARIEDGVTQVLVNCERVELINSYGISALLSTYDRLDAGDGVLSFSDVGSIMLENALEVSGLLTFCAGRIFESEDEAIAALTSR